MPSFASRTLQFRIPLLLAPPPRHPMRDKLLPYGPRFSGGALFLLCSLLLLGPLLSLTAWSAVHDRIVAVINTEVITQTELEEEVNEVKSQARQRFKGPELDRRLRQIDYMGINRMIERKLQIQIAKRRGIKVSD